MRSLFGILAVVVGLLITQGCTTLPEPLVEEVRSVGVVALLSDEFPMLTIGTTVFNNNDDVGDIADWGLNARIIDSLTSNLAERYEIVEVDYPRLALNAEAKEKITGGWINDVNKQISDLLRGRLSPPAGAAAPDAYVVVLPQYSSTAFRGYPSFVDFGLYSMSLLGSRKTYVYVGAQMALVDAESFEVLRRKSFYPSFSPENPEKRVKGGGLSYVRIDNAAWAKDFESLSEAQKAIIRGALENFIGDAARRTSEQIGLVPVSE